MSTTVQWRPQLNALTTPRSYKAQPVPKESLGYDEMAALIAQKNQLWSPGLVKSILLEEREAVKEQLVNGNQVSYENAFTYHISLATRLDAPDDPLPPADEIVKVQVYASRTFVEEVRQDVHLEKLPPLRKLPVIAGTEDTVLQLNDVLNPLGVLRLTGADLFFDLEDGTGECVLEGTRSGRTVQSRFGRISNSEIIVVPEIPVRPDQWNNEYRVSVSTHYTEHGSLRTGVGPQPLRTPLAVVIGDGNGILSGKEVAPLVTVSNGDLTSDTERVRIQVLLDAQDGDLRFNLINMSENGAAGDEVRVSSNGTYTLPGFAGSPLNSLEVTVNSYTDLEQIVRTDYTGRLVDILDVTN